MTRKKIIGRNGMVSLVNAKETGLPIFDRVKIKEEEGESTGITVDHCTKKELESLLLFLTKDEEEELIVAFVRSRGFRGVMPLYSVHYIGRLRHKQRKEAEPGA